MANRISFRARIVPGSGRGKDLGVPTFNLDLADVPPNLEEGIHAVWVTDHTAKSEIPALPAGRRNPKSEDPLPAVMHYGPRPVFRDTRSCEVHLLSSKEWRVKSEELRKCTRLTVEVVEKIRDVRDFESVEALKQEMVRDIAKAREVLSATP